MAPWPIVNAPLASTPGRRQTRRGRWITYPLFDSPVICDWLDAAGSGPGLLPPAGPERWAVLGAQALADGVMDEAVAVVMGRRRPGQDPALEVSALAAVERGLDWLEGQPEAWTGGLDLGYRDFRLPELCWGQTRPGSGGLV